MPQPQTPDLREFVDRLTSILTKKTSPDVRIQEALRVLEKVQEKDWRHSRSTYPILSNEFHLKPGSGSKSPVSHTRVKARSATLIGESPAMQAIYDAIERVGNSQATVLIRGESGTGKELVAKAIHESSLRKSLPFIPVHCAAVPDSLIESTLFGHDRGAFTGAMHTRKGKLEQASGGTLFLDEVGDIPLSTQIKLLRVIQEREYERVGGTQSLQADVRIVAATHRDLESMVCSGAFREDLYYRLNVVPLILPPLRERQEDITALVDHFLDRFNRENHRRVRLSTEVLSMLVSYHWPGNIRELQNCLERMVVLADSSTMTISAIPKALKSYIDHIRDVTISSGKAVISKSSETLPKDVRNLERDRLREVLEDVGWVKAKAGRVLGLTPRQVAYKMKKYEIHSSRTLS